MSLSKVFTLTETQYFISETTNGNRAYPPGLLQGLDELIILVEHQGLDELIMFVEHQGLDELIMLVEHQGLNELMIVENQGLDELMLVEHLSVSWHRGSSR